jgi:hypothetical protein
MKQFLFLVAAMAFSVVANAGGVMGAAALRAHYSTLAPRLAASDFGGRLLLQSEESARRIEGEVFALVEHPFAAVANVLAEPAAWCEILILHLNTKSCVRSTDARGTSIEMRVGKKEPQPPDEASLVAFRWLGATKRADYVVMQMDAQEGPYDTRDYRLFAEAVQVEGRTFVHMGYAFSYGGAGSLAMKIYLATVARNKVGFTKTGDKLVGGVRGIAERNTMRYYLAIDAYLDSLAFPNEKQLERRITYWFDATEKFPRQLHEIERDEYLAMKREELRRPQK